MRTSPPGRHHRAELGSLAAHASQGKNIVFLHGLEKFTELMGEETLSRVRDTTNAPLPEKDLFEGLR